MAEDDSEEILPDDSKASVRDSQLYVKSDVSDADPYNDEVISVIGDGKRWQIMVTIVLSLCGLCPEFNNTLAVQAFFSPRQILFYCHQYPKYSNWTKEKWMLLSHYNGTDPCRIYDLNYDSLPSNFTPSINSPTVACNNTTFLDEYGHTLTEKVSKILLENFYSFTEWKMICHREHLIATYQYLFYIGKILGNVLFGIWCDRRGRRNLLIVCVLTQPLFGIMLPSSSNFNLFVLEHTCLGMFVGGAFVLSLVYAVEVMGPRTCTIFAASAFFSIPISSFCLAFIQLMLPRWFYLQLFISIPVLIFLVWMRIFEESPRWLLVMHRPEEALSVMRYVADRNHIYVSPTVKLLPAPQTGLVGEEDDDRDCNIWHVKHYPNLRLLVVLLIFLNYGISTILQVRTLRFKILRTQLFVRAATMGCMELMSVGCTVFLLIKIGHSKVTCISMILYGLLNFFLLMFVHSMEEEDYVMTVILNLFAYFMVIMAYVSTCVYSSRVLPTIIRGSGIGLSIAAYNIGLMLTAFLLESGKVADVQVFIVSMSMLAFLLALVAYVLPEVFDRELPDTLRDGEHFQRLEDDFERHLAEGVEQYLPEDDVEF